MRALIAALALPLALLACGAPNTSSDTSDATEEAAGGYTLEVRAVQGVETLIVIAPDGRRTAARTTQGVSALLDEQAIQGLGEMQPLSDEPNPEVFAMRMPGVNISVAADENDPNGDSATVSVNAGGRTVHVDAQDGGAGENDDRANVRITGATESDARDFINDNEDVSAEVKTQMLAAIGLQ